MQRAKRRVSNENGSDTELTFTPSGAMMCTITRRSRYDLVLDRTGLTRRQIEVLQSVSNQQSNKEISAHLNISVSTVKFHIGTLMRKFDVDSRHKLKGL